MKKHFWNTEYFKWGVTAFAVFAFCLVLYLSASRGSGFFGGVSKVVSSLTPVIYGLVFAYILNKVMSFFERVVFRNYTRKSKRVICLSLTMLVAVAFVGGVLALIIPRIYDSMQRLVSNMTGYYNTATKWLNKVLEDNPELETVLVNLVGNVAERLREWIQNVALAQMNRIIASVTTGVIGFVRVLINFIIGLIFSVYLLYQKEHFAGQMKKIIYGLQNTSFANRTLQGFRFLDKTFGSFLTSRLIDAFIIAVVCYVFMLIFNMPYAILIAVMVGVTNIIPFFGPFIGAIPSAALVLLENPAKCVIFVIFIIILQQIDGNILFPKIQGSRTGFSGFWILSAILFFGGTLGFWGFIIGVPIFAVIYAAIKSFIDARLERRVLPTDTAVYEKITGFDEKTHIPVFRDGEDGV